MFGWGLNLVTTVIGFGMSAAFIIFVCARLICGRIRSTDHSPIIANAPPYDIDIDIDLPSDLGQPQIDHNLNGLEPLTIAAIPTINYNHLTFHSKDNAQCSICLGDYEEKEMLRVIPACHHNFHLVCIDLWLQKQSTCPICRLPLKDLFQGKCATASSPTALAPNSLLDTPLSTNQLITNAASYAVSGDSVQVQVIVT